MSPAAKLAGFAAMLGAVFAVAMLAGSQVDVGTDETGAGARDTAAEAGGHGEDRTPPQTVRGLAVSDDGLTLEPERTTAPRNARFDLAFRIADRRGRTVRDFDLEHTKRMHVIVVRRDMTGFQHVHPVQRRDGSWTVPVTLREAGAYRLFADFSVDGRPRTLAADLTVDGAVLSRPLPPPVDSVTVDGLRVSLAQGAARAGMESDLRFAVTRDGRPVAVRDFLGAKGHLVALREGDLAYLHVHPDEDSLRFMATFPTAGRYRLYLQFKTYDGRLRTAALTQEVTR
jgi:hypothetical protein